MKSIFLNKEKQQEQWTKEKFVLLLINNSKSSVSSNHSRGSHHSNKSTGSSSIGRGGAGGGVATAMKLVDKRTAKLLNNKALGLTNSMEKRQTSIPQAVGMLRNNGHQKFLSCGIVDFKPLSPTLQARGLAFFPSP